MPDLYDGESIEMQGSGSRPYVLKNIGGVYSCTCPAWRNRSIGIERRSCMHPRQLRGDSAQEARIGAALPAKPVVAAGESTAPPLLLAESWDGVTDPAGWLTSEKLDSVRAYWDGEASVIEHQGGAGRHKGRLGALLVELDDGTRFAVGTGLCERVYRAPGGPVSVGEGTPSGMIVRPAAPSGHGTA